ncbi:tetraacyldisaccharide 4'-kinase [Belliella sp. DSM 107340]|uniref:Tetraacyldisaccharide 4'-kinase n=1 Tax=Belliella calami TaxID=2923436 RepID=A0ABS9UIQ6_9BACT|nr:tetraacyldisaccharide 4'-kinase [Belliella calami]MCH7396388.1 tetraacyldisaccharide 4'-kinase [Belliella calami]
MPWFEPLLYPFSFIYDGVTKVRNRLFDTGYKKSVSFSIPTIVVGNLSMGGTGKTPFVEFLIRLLSDFQSICTLSRGYGRKTTGFILADEDSNASQIGDEPFQIYSKFKPDVAVAVGEDRVMAIPMIIANLPSTDLILLDDAFQHRYVKGDLNILLTTFQKPFFDDRVVPVGTLREARAGAIRADIIVVTKCPEDFDESTKNFYQREIRVYNSHAKIIFAGLKYGEPVSLVNPANHKLNEVILVSGIANDELLRREVSKHYEVKEVFTFSDHHHYKISDVKNIAKSVRQNSNSAILTTEKDAVKLKDPIFREYLAEIAIFALPIEISLSKGDSQWIKDKISEVVKEKGYIREN